MYLINNDVVFVKGALNGAIYDFNTRKVYSVNNDACNIIENLISDKRQFTDKEINYLETLKNAQLYSDDFRIRKYEPRCEEKFDLKMVWLEITQSCNMKCLHCYEGDIHESSGEVLTLGEWKKIIDDLKALNVKRVVVIGGEPCVHKNIGEILEYLTEKKISTTLFTNGSLLTDSLIKLIIKNDIKVKVSLYGHNPEIHDAITKVNGSFELLINNIKTLKNNGVTVDVAVVAMKENQGYMNHIKSLINSLGIKYHGFDVIRNVFGGTQSNHTPDNEEVLSKAKYTKPSFITSKESFNKNVNRNSCWYGKLAIIENGNVLPCVFERNLSYGNLKDNSLKEIMNGSSLKENWTRDFSKIETCKLCEFRFSCKDCRPLGISIQGSIYGKNPRCKYNPYTGQWGE